MPQPPFVNDELSGSSDALALKILFGDAANKISWPQQSDTLLIRIIKSSPDCSENAIKTVWKALSPRVNSGAGAPRPPMAFSNPEIQIGHKLFAGDLGEGRRLSALLQARPLASTPSDANILVAVHMLAHETFHVSEASRMSSCGVQWDESQSGFAKGLWPQMKADWREVAANLGVAYGNQERLDSTNPLNEMNINALKAHDLVSEGCADLLGVKLLADAKLAWELALEALIEMRLSDQQKGRESYQIGDGLQKICAPYFANRALPDSEKIIGDVWKHALNTVLLDTSLTAVLQEKIRRVLCSPLLFEAPKSRFSF